MIDKEDYFKAEFLVEEHTDAKEDDIIESFISNIYRTKGYDPMKVMILKKAFLKEIDRLKNPLTPPVLKELSFVKSIEKVTVETGNRFINKKREIPKYIIIGEEVLIRSDYERDPVTDCRPENYDIFDIRVESGLPVYDEEVSKILKSVGFEVTENKDSTTNLVLPSRWKHIRNVPEYTDYFIDNNNNVRILLDYRNKDFKAFPRYRFAIELGSDVTTLDQNVSLVIRGFDVDHIMMEIHIDFRNIKFLDIERRKNPNYKHYNLTHPNLILEVLTWYIRTVLIEKILQYEDFDNPFMYWD